MGIETKKMAKNLVAAAPNEESALGRAMAWPDRFRNFLKDVRNEMRKVSSPSRKEVQATTGVVLITVFLFAIYFFLIDQALGRGIDWLLRTAGR